MDSRTKIWLFIATTIIHLQNPKRGALQIHQKIREIFTKMMDQSWSGVEDDGAASAFPAHGFVVAWILVSSGIICNGGYNWWRVPLTWFGLIIVRNLDCLTRATRTAPSFTSWRPWTNLCSQSCLVIFIHCLLKTQKHRVNAYYPNICQCYDAVFTVHHVLHFPVLWFINAFNIGVCTA